MLLIHLNHMSEDGHCFATATGDWGVGYPPAGTEANDVTELKFFLVDGVTMLLKSQCIGPTGCPLFSCCYQCSLGGGAASFSHSFMAGFLDGDYISFLNISILEIVIRGYWTVV